MLGDSGIDEDEQDNFDIERNELLRLMKSAKDDSRRSIIQESLHNLDSPDRKYKSGKHLGTHNVLSEHNNVYKPEKLNGAFSKSPPIRPISARLRRPSMNSLDVIQEEKRLLEKNIDLEDQSSISFIQLEDVYEYSTSSFDPSLSAWNPFVSSSSQSGTRWVSTGMLPQFLSIDLKLCWLIVDIKVVGYGLEKVTISIEGSVNRAPMIRENSTTFKFVSGVNKESPEDGQSKIFGDRILITCEQASDMFFALEKVRIRAVPTGA